LNSVGRRSFLAGSAAFVACRAANVPKVDRIGVWSSCDLPATNDTHGLSAMVWDERGRSAYAVQDKHPTIVALSPDRELRTWQVGGRVRLDLLEPVDLEALALLPDGFLVASEIGPRIFEIDRAGHVRGELSVPRSLRSARENRSLESLALSPDGHYIFTANEQATPADGAFSNAERGTLVRIVRIDRTTGDVVERPYLTDRGFDDGDYGVADLAALSSTQVLVLERGWSKSRGNAVRIYRAALDETESAKQLVVDLATLDVRGLNLPAPHQPQPSPLLDNFEGLSIGPRLPDGGRSLLLVSDDNGRASQVARVLVLTWP
jgi:hypothetical protein